MKDIKNNLFNRQSEKSTTSSKENFQNILRNDIKSLYEQEQGLQPKTYKNETSLNISSPPPVSAKNSISQSSDHAIISNESEADVSISKIKSDIDKLEQHSISGSISRTNSYNSTHNSNVNFARSHSFRKAIQSNQSQNHSESADRPSHFSQNIAAVAATLTSVDESSFSDRESLRDNSDQQKQKKQQQQHQEHPVFNKKTSLVRRSSSSSSSIRKRTDVPVLPIEQSERFYSSNLINNAGKISNSNGISVEIPVQNINYQLKSLSPTEINGPLSSEPQTLFKIPDYAKTRGPSERLLFSPTSGLNKQHTTTTSTTAHSQGFHSVGSERSEPAGSSHANSTYLAEEELREIFKEQEGGDTYGTVIYAIGRAEPRKDDQRGQRMSGKYSSSGRIDSSYYSVILHYSMYLTRLKTKNKG